MEPYHLSKVDALGIFLAILIPIVTIAGATIAGVWLLLGSVQWLATILTLIVTIVATCVVCFFCMMAFFFTEIG